MTHWASQYIGRPWTVGGQGPDSFDCWGFVRFVQKEHYGRDLPFIDIDANNLRATIKGMMFHDVRKVWENVSRPSDGDAVLMAHGKYPTHVGIWVDVDGGGVLHCTRGEGVVFSSLSALRIAGWGRIEYYRYVGNP